MSIDNDWKGVPMSHIIGSQLPWGAPEFPLIQPGFKHSVLYHIPASDMQFDQPPKPQVGKDKWDHEHVRMPFSKKNLYPVLNDAGRNVLTNRWKLIQEALSAPIRDCKELVDTILRYNMQFKDRWKFSSLHSLFESLDEDESQYFFDVTLPEIAKVALALPKLIQAPIPLLKQHKNQSVSLSQQQISSLLANAFFCTFPRRNSFKKGSEYSEYPSINFSVLYNTSPAPHVLEKLKCICHYFRRVCRKVPVGVVTVSRRSVQPRSLPSWQTSAKPLAELPVHVDPQNTIEDADGLIQVDFANKFLGGGVLGQGSVQEEIRFVICPELMVSMLIAECLRPNEALMIIGCEQFCTYTGYGHTFQWSGDYTDHTPHDSSGRRRCSVLAIDAMPFVSKLQEHRKEALIRELNKAWVGFSFYTPDEPGLNYPGVATGNWGCGAFGGTAALKSLLQMMALTEAGRPMAYYTFGDVKLRDDIVRVYNLLVRHCVTVGGIYGLILDYCKTDVLKCNMYTFLEKVLDGRDSSCQTQKSNQNESMEYTVETEQYDLPLPVEMALDKSPDLFDEDDSQFIIPAKLKVNLNNQGCLKELNKPDNAEVKNADQNMSSDSEIILIDIDDNISSNSKQIDCDNKMSADSNKMAEHKTLTSPGEASDDSKEFSRTSRLFEQLTKLDEDSGKLNLKSPQNSIFDHRSRQTDVRDTSNTSNKTSKPSDERGKLDDVGKLNLKSPHKSFAGQNSKVASASHIDSKIHTDVSPDVKKKLTRKITDYFNKKTI